jgi:RimJ/RimL family protein N-acetyltransferase
VTSSNQPDVVLVATDGDAELRAAVLRLTPRPDQEQFSSRATETLPVAEADPFRTPFAITYRGEAIGFGVLDRKGYLDEVGADKDRAVLLRAFYLAAGWQGKGLGGAAIRALPALARVVRPDAGELKLTVNVRNEQAFKAYLASGFSDSGELYFGGDAGPQHVLRWTLS